MSSESALAWLERRAEHLRAAESVVQVTVRQLRPRRRDPVWLMQVVLDSGGAPAGDLLGDLVRDLGSLGTRPTICIDERPRDGAQARPELAHVA
jgi:hypothetical protein